MPEIIRFTIFPDSVETESLYWREAPLLSDFLKVFPGLLPELTTRTIKGAVRERVVAMDEFGFVVNIDLPEERVRRFTVFFVPNAKWVGNVFQGVVNVNETELRRGSTVKSLVHGNVFKFEHQIAVGRGISLMYEPKYEFIENLTVGFRYPEPEEADFVRERVAQLHALN